MCLATKRDVVGGERRRRFGGGSKKMKDRVVTTEREHRGGATLPLSLFDDSGHLHEHGAGPRQFWVTPGQYPGH
jgi:hypothetical protein